MSTNLHVIAQSHQPIASPLSMPSFGGSHRSRTIPQTSYDMMGLAIHGLCTSELRIPISFRVIRTLTLRKDMHEVTCAYASMVTLREGLQGFRSLMLSNFFAPMRQSDLVYTFPAGNFSRSSRTQVTRICISSNTTHGLLP